MEIQKITLNQERNVSLTAILQDVGGEFIKIKKRPAVLILPGGGYNICSDTEAEPVALAYSKAGYQAFILRYSVGVHKQWPNPLNDYEEAMKLIKANSAVWNIYDDKIAVVGFSAGGHLAACAATISQNRPSAAILGYAALDQDTCDMCQEGLPLPVETVDEFTCPCFLFGTRDDVIVPIKNTIDFQLALAKWNISFESHIYAYGPHGFSVGESFLLLAEACDRVSNWVNDSIKWLKDMLGDFGDQEMTKPVCEPKINGDLKPYLSVDCTIELVRKHNDSLDTRLTTIIGKFDAFNKERNKKGTKLTPFQANIRIKDWLAMLRISEKEQSEIDMFLNRISNQAI